MKRCLILIISIIKISILNSVDNIYFDAERASNYLSIPSYVSGNDEVVHPDVLYFPSGWNGYKYWMSFTPFPYSAPEYENPSIVVSQDGLIWSVPTGLTNPVIETYPDNSDPNNYYLSDPDLIMSADGLTMYLCWRDHYGWNAEYFSVSSSTDGVNWTDPVYPFNTLSTNGERMLSPTLVYTGSEYELYTVNSKTSPRTYYKRTASTPDGTWSSKTEVGFPIYDGTNWIDPDTYTGDLAYASQVWHMDMLYEDNEYWLIASVGGATQTRGGQLWIAKSTDGSTWTFDNNPLLDYEVAGWDKLIYRSTAIPFYQNEVMNLKIWYSSDGGTGTDNLEWHIGYTIAYSPDYTLTSVEMTAFLATFNSSSNDISLQWSTGSERNALGFNVLSYSNRDFSKAEMKNGALIPAENNNQGAYYTFTDEYPLNTEEVFYWLEMVSFDGESEFYGPVKAQVQGNNNNGNGNGLKPGFTGVYPNPFNPTTEISFNLANKGPVIIQVFNLQGKLMWQHKPGQLSAGRHTVVFDANKIDKMKSSGVYFCKYTDSFGSTISKMVLLK